MKAAHNLFRKTLLTGMAFACYYLVTAQPSDKQQEIENSIKSRHFIFVAQTLSPMSGSMRNLTSVYDLKVSGDTLISSLPYIGRAYSAPINPSEAGFNFTTTHFNLDQKPRKKGGWDIIISPKDAGDVRQMVLTAFPNGSATLRVTSNNRQPISYNGYIKALE
jgi:hypothetical protein